MIYYGSQRSTSTCQRDRAIPPSKATSEACRPAITSSLVMQRDLLKSRLSKLPQLPALDHSGAEVRDDEAEELRDSFSTSLAPPPPR